MDVKLVSLGGEWTDQLIPITGTELIIGRAATCDLQIDHSLVSNEHCRIVVRDNRVTVDDLDSTFGTSVNGRKIQHAELRDSDRLKVGPATFLVALSGGVPAARAAADDDDQLAAPRGRDPNEDTAAVEAARQAFERLTSRASKPTEPTRPATPPGPPPAAGAPRQKARLEVQDNEGIARVNILDRAIIQDHDIQQIGQELDDLIQGGQNRIIVDFGNVKHMSSQAVGILLQAQKRCKAVGGLLKLCNPNPEVAEIFKITNLPRVIEIHPDDDRALQSPWPEPVEEPPPTPPTTAEKIAAAAARIAASAPAATTPVRTATLDVQLVIGVGKSQGKTIKIPGPSFLVGRDASCQLRPASEAVSRVHTRIDQREGRVFVRDMGTTNGTALGTRVLHDEEAEAHDGDNLAIGPLAFTFRITGAAAPAAAGIGDQEDAAASWLLQSPVSGGDTALLPTIPTPKESAADTKGPVLRTLRTRVIGDVLIATVLPATLVEEDQIGPLRHELIALLDQDVPHRLILRMERVTALSDQAVSMFMAHYQRLDRLGGGLRFCTVRDEVLPALESQRVAMLVQVYPNAEAAIRDPWPMT